MNRMLTEAGAEKRRAFEKYLESAPNITDPTDRHQCGSTRGYFGFEENFINDAQICEDIEQLKYSRDFDFLDEFLAQGSETLKADVYSLELKPPDRSMSSLYHLHAVQSSCCSVAHLCALTDFLYSLQANRSRPRF